jgi:hypothetical protein
VRSKGQLDSLPCRLRIDIHAAVPSQKVQKRYVILFELSQFRIVFKIVDYPASVALLAVDFAPTSRPRE